MRINPDSGLIEGVAYLPSPHRGERTADIDLLVIHNISLPPGQFGGQYVHDLFQGTLDTSAHPYFERLSGLQVSSHLLIQRTGVITQFVPFHEVAWHAGVSSFEGREACNQYSIGIELEGTDDEPFEAVQYEVLSKISQELVKIYPKINKGRIVGHSDVAPGRKTDPGPYFDWGYYHCILDGLSA